MNTLAYLDAGTGSLMLQALVGGLAGLAVMARLFSARIRRALFFWRASSGVDEAQHDDAVNESPTSHRT